MLQHLPLAAADSFYIQHATGNIYTALWVTEHHAVDTECGHTHRSLFDTVTVGCSFTAFQQPTHLAAIAAGSAKR